LIKLAEDLDRVASGAAAADTLGAVDLRKCAGRKVTGPNLSLARR
jgi:hypothetical protein